MTIAEPAFLEPGQKEPGGWKTPASGPGMVWDGEMSWRTRHGAAVVRWLLGKPKDVENAELAEGGRIPLATARVNEVDVHNWRRGHPSGQGYIRGSIEIRDDGVTFTDAPDADTAAVNPPRVIAEIRGPMIDLWNDRVFRDEILNDDVASATVAKLQNTNFRRNGAAEGRWMLSFRTIAAAVAELRGLNEDYTDWYCHDIGFSAAEDIIVEAALERIGWHAVGEDEDRVDAERAMALLAEVEAKPAGERPGWTVGWREPGGDGPIDRMTRAALSGRASRDQHARVIHLLM